jgi:hypothetical protein
LSSGDEGDRTPDLLNAMQKVEMKGKHNYKPIHYLRIALFAKFTGFMQEKQV